MKLANVLNHINLFEKNSFLRVIDNIISDKPKNFKEIDKILKQTDGQLKNADIQSVEEVLNLIENEFCFCINEELTNTTSHLDILIDIIIRDGNSLMKREWLLKLYEKEVRNIKSKLKQFAELLDSDNEDGRINFYRIYKQCLTTAYNNDLKNNLESKITKDEQSILSTLAKGLELSHEEVKLINYTVIPLKKLDIDEIIKYLTKIGVVLYSRKNHQVFVPDEVVRTLRKVRGKELPDKIFRRVLKQLKDSQINLLCRKHNIDWKLDRDAKIKEIIKEGISFTNAMLKGIHKDGINKTEKRAVLNNLVDKKLKIETHIKGTSLESKLEHLILYFDSSERDGSLSISIHGYDKLLLDLKEDLSKLDKVIRSEFELQDNIDIDAKTLLEHNIKPKDILYLLDDDQIKKFCEQRSVSIRGNEVNNILSEYKDTKNLLIENYHSIAERDLNALKEKGINIKESELGIKFEELTKNLFSELGFNIDNTLRKGLNNSKNKVDIIINLGDSELIIIECKSKKDKTYNKYSGVSRQVKAYKELAERNDYTVKKSFIISPAFSEDFVRECSLDFELNLSLITAESLINIHQAFKESRFDEFPINLFMRDVLIDGERTIKALER